MKKIDHQWLRREFILGRVHMVYDDVRTAICFRYIIDRDPMQLLRELDALYPTKRQLCRHQEHAPLARPQVDEDEATIVPRKGVEHAFEYGGGSRQVFVGVPRMLARQKKVLRQVNAVGFYTVPAIVTCIKHVPMETRLNSVRDFLTEPREQLTTPPGNGQMTATLSPRSAEPLSDGYLNAANGTGRPSALAAAAETLRFQ